jgi:hypothetical protein
VDGGFLVPYFQTIPWDYVRPKVYQQERRFGDIPMFLENPTGIHSMSDIFTIQVGGERGYIQAGSVETHFPII